MLLLQIVSDTTVARGCILFQSQLDDVISQWPQQGGESCDCEIYVAHSVNYERDQDLQNMICVQKYWMLLAQNKIRVTNDTCKYYHLQTIISEKKESRVKLLSHTRARNSFGTASRVHGFPGLNGCKRILMAGTGLSCCSQIPQI
jgi:hypothetical protein